LISAAVVVFCPPTERHQAATNASSKICFIVQDLEICACVK
jgi:hypothetical protein